MVSQSLFFVYGKSQAPSIIVNKLHNILWSVSFPDVAAFSVLSPLILWCVPPVLFVIPDDQNVLYPHS